MKRIIVLCALVAYSIMLLSACGGSGTPLTSSQKTAHVTFSAVTTAMGFKTNILEVKRFILPPTVSVARDTGASISTGSLNSLKASGYPLGSYFPNYSSSTNGKVHFSIVDNSSNVGTPTWTGLGFGLFAELNCTITDVSITETSLTNSINALNPSMQAIAFGLNSSTTVPYRINVKIQ